MYTSDTTTTVSQGNTKSTIQALLKSKEQCPIPADSSKDKGFWSNYCTASDFSDLETLPQNLLSESKSPASPDSVSNNANSQESLEHQKDFNYSQKLFHIADGNLYSIFSPIQGRSYGMKPSFLRKQKYTVQECHNRGRKNLRKGLKFHNFLPSESVTSEKDNGYMNAKWKVHSECRLREEHGTKQITISNWSQSIQNPPAETVKSGLTASPSSTETNNAEQSLFIKPENGSLDNETKLNVGDPYDFNLNSQSFSSKNEIMHLKQIRSKSDVVHKSSSNTSTKKDSLNYVLNSLIQKPLLTEKVSFSDEADNQNKSCQKHRRKPVQTRRIVPYVKYLSIMEENETLPLDLSSKCLIENSPSHSVNLFSHLEKTDIDFNRNNSNIECDKNVKNAISNYLSSHDTFTIPNTSSDKLMVNPVDEMVYPPITTPVSLLYPFNKNPNLEQNGLYASRVQEPSSSKLEINTNQHVFSMPSDKSYMMNQSIPTTQFSVQKSLVKEVQSKPRRRNQRSAIKQKLEDTFRQNGFLVKTKQVSDGEATFCKFRQLRKYTRYYLKSLEQHLPDEFHKMWKGFLPPKTVLPPVLGPPDPVNDSLS